jgi:hypothetical protein
VLTAPVWEATRDPNDVARQPFGTVWLARCRQLLYPDTRHCAGHGHKKTYFLALALAFVLRRVGFEGSERRYEPASFKATVVAAAGFLVAGNVVLEPLAPGTTIVTTTAMSVCKNEMSQTFQNRLPRRSECQLGLAIPPESPEENKQIGLIFDTAASSGGNWGPRLTYNLRPQDRNPSCVICWTLLARVGARHKGASINAMHHFEQR